MPEQKSAFRRRVTPKYLFTLNVEDASGKWPMEFPLCYTLNAFCLFEAETGRNFLREMAEILDVPSINILTVLLWAGATDWKDPDRDMLDALRDNATLSDLPAIKEAIIKALLAQLPPEVKARLEALLAGKEVPADPTQAAPETVSQ